MTHAITIFSARKILTMNTYQPVATHVAVREGRVLGTGSLDELAKWGDYTIDKSFADKVLLPGFVKILDTGHTRPFGSVRSKRNAGAEYHFPLQ